MSHTTAVQYTGTNLRTGSNWRSAATA